MTLHNPIPQSVMQLTVSTAQGGQSLADDEGLIDLLAEELAADVMDQVTPHAMDYMATRTDSDLQAMSADSDGAVGNTEELEEIADEISDALIDPLGDRLANVQAASLETATSVVAMQSAGAIEMQGLGKFFKRVGRGIKKGVKAVGGFLKTHGKKILKEAAGFALRSAIGLFSAAGNGVQQLGLFGSLIRKGVKLAAPHVISGVKWIGRKVKEKAKEMVREGLRRVHKIADEKIAALSAPAPTPVEPSAPVADATTAPWISAQNVAPGIAPQASMWKNPSFV